MRKFFEETLSKAMRLSFALTCSALLFFGMCINMPSASAADIEIGSYIEMGTYYGESILWRCVGFERISGYDDNGNPIIDSTDTSTEYREGYLPLILADKIICLKPFDAKTSSESETGSHGRRANIDNCGSNYWADSNMRSWLNSSESAGEVTWLCGNPPAGELAGTYSLVGSNPYDMEAGFLTNFSQEEISAAETVAQKSIAAYPEYESGIYDSGSELFICNKDIDKAVQNYRDAYSETMTDTMFLLDVKQANEVYANSGVLGEDYYIGEPTEQCIENSEYVSYSTGSENKWNYWLRTPDTDYKIFGRISTGYISYGGSVLYTDTVDGEKGVRPAFFLAADMGFICGDGTNDSPYRISYQEEAEEPEESEAPSDWAQSEINEALELGILPDSIRSEWQSPITRLEFCRLAWILYSGLAENEEYSDDFTDTSDLSSEDGAAVSAAAELGIITGYEDGTFRPYDEIMRDEAAAILMRISKLITGNEAVTADDTEFTDCGGIWAREAIEYVCGLGIMRGVESVYEISEATVGKRHIVTFAPYDTYTREQAVLTVYRLYKSAVENRF